MRKRIGAVKRQVEGGHGKCVEPLLVKVSWHGDGLWMGGRLETCKRHVGGGQEWLVAMVPPIYYSPYPCQTLDSLRLELAQLLMQI